MFKSHIYQNLFTLLSIISCSYACSMERKKDDEPIIEMLSVTKGFHDKVTDPFNKRVSSRGTLLKVPKKQLTAAWNQNLQINGHANNRRDCVRDGLRSPGGTKLTNHKRVAVTPLYSRNIEANTVQTSQSNKSMVEDWLKTVQRDEK